MKLIVPVLVITIFTIFYFLIPKGTSSSEPQSITKVVGNYKDCEIVEYNNSMQSRYHYFLYCSQK